MEASLTPEAWHEGALTEEDDSGFRLEKLQVCSCSLGEQVRAGGCLCAFYLDLAAQMIAGPGEERPGLLAFICSMISAETL